MKHIEFLKKMSESLAPTVQNGQALPELEFLKSLWGLGTEEE
jgi:hypothetical protein